MGMILSAFVFALLGLIGAAFAKLLADEYKAWSPTLNSYILAVAARMVPIEQRERFSEESSSHLNDLPGDLSRTAFAVNCLFAAIRIDNLPTKVTRRALDISFALGAISFLAPILILAVTAVSLDSAHRRILHRETRVGLNGKRFTLFKFRADEGTPLADFLKRTSVEELPQLFNVLRGDMSLMGPKPLDETDVTPHLTERPGLSSARNLRSFLTDFINLLKEK